jgi:hypothetical protein
MTLKNTIIVFLIFIMTANCSLEENNRNEQKSEPATVAVKNGDAKAKDAACYDAKMEKWFTAFNYYQQQGLKMKEADKKANEDADRMYNDCVLNTELASNTPPAEANNE